MASVGGGVRRRLRPTAFASDDGFLRGQKGAEKVSFAFVGTRVYAKTPSRRGAGRVPCSKRRARFRHGKRGDQRATTTVFRRRRVFVRARNPFVVVEHSFYPRAGWTEIDDGGLGRKRRTTEADGAKPTLRCRISRGRNSILAGARNARAPRVRGGREGENVHATSGNVVGSANRLFFFF